MTLEESLEAGAATAGPPIRPEDNTPRLRCAVRATELGFRWRNAALRDFTLGRIPLVRAT